MFVSNTLAWHISCRVRSRFYSLSSVPGTKFQRDQSITDNTGIILPNEDFLSRASNF